MPNLLRLFKEFDAAPLPKFKRMALEEIPPSSVLLFYGGNKLTELFGNRVHRHPYRPPAFHAAMTVGDGKMLNVGKFRTIEQFKKELTERRRVDVIVYDMSDAQREAIVASCRKDITTPKVGFMLPDYGWSDYLRFGFKWFKPSSKDFCSENCVEHAEEVGLTISWKESYNTAPWHLLEYALDHPGKCTISTIHIGNDFGG